MPAGFRVPAWTSMVPELLTRKPIDAVPAGPAFCSRPSLLKTELGEKKLDSAAESGRVKVPPGRLFQTALLRNVIDWPAGTVALPKLSTGRPSRVEKNPPDSAE